MSIWDNAYFWHYVYVMNGLGKSSRHRPVIMFDGREIPIVGEERKPQKRTPLFGGGDVYDNFATFWIPDIVRFEADYRVFEYFQEPDEPFKPNTFHMMAKNVMVHPYSSEEEVDHVMVLAALTVTIPEGWDLK